MTTNELRVVNAKKKLIKLEEKLNRINIALVGGKNPYNYSEYDLKNVNKDIRETKINIIKYEEKIKSEQSIESVEAIEKFLDIWEKKALDWYREDFKSLTNYINHRRTKLEAFQSWKQEKFNSVYVDNEETKTYEIQNRIDRVTYKSDIEKFNTLTIKLKDYGKDWEQHLEKTIARDKIAKRKNLVNRVKKVVGDITDASNLYVADNMEINGIIIGTMGKAEVKTITAGGYNIQVFHYRVLVNKL